MQKLDFLDTSGVTLLRRVAVLDVPESEVLVIPSDSSGVSRILAVTGSDSVLRFAAEPHNVAVA